MDAPAEAIGGMNRYLTVCFIGIPFIIAYNYSIISFVHNSISIVTARILHKDQAA